MIKSYNYKDLVWVDMESPTREEAREVMEKYDIHPLAIEELLLPTTKHQVEQYEDFIYTTLHFPAWKHSHKDTIQEVDFIIGKKIIVTNHYENIDAIHKFAKILEVNKALDKQSGEVDHAGVIFYHILKELYVSLEDELDAVRDSLTEIEDSIFQGKEKEMVFSLSKVSRELLSFKHAINPQKEILDTIGSLSIKLFGDGYHSLIRSVEMEHARIERATSKHKESLVELRETNNSLLETKQDNTIQTLTAITIITSALSIFVVFLEVDAVTELTNRFPNDLLVIIGTMILITGIMFAIFKWKRWL